MQAAYRFIRIALHTSHGPSLTDRRASLSVYSKLPTQDYMPTVIYFQMDMKSVGSFYYENFVSFTVFFLILFFHRFCFVFRGQIHSQFDITVIALKF